MHRTAPHNKELSSPKCQQCWGWETLDSIQGRSWTAWQHIWHKLFHHEWSKGMLNKEMDQRIYRAGIGETGAFKNLCTKTSRQLFGGKNSELEPAIQPQRENHSTPICHSTPERKSSTPPSFGYFIYKPWMTVSSSWGVSKNVAQSRCSLIFTTQLPPCPHSYTHTHCN